ncbi:NAD(P)-binding protein [Hypoxylon trugodes]|uniref:NAD(P)-binding protein n=1 Tax=Hypoxylon trugodes TaxID=326681 RepID=UPI002193A413|nr:NAD(P)-binding protein [Hypoxylon trugodes]KAI1389115.1 NAD(P)-binding protein [Hypoxylon trugodes]
MPKVLLTGGSGFIAAHVLDILLKRGYEVITTVRSETKATQIRTKYPNAPLSVAIVPDIAAPNAFDDVLAQNGSGLDYVQHTASPFHYKWKDARTEVLDPAINGTNSVFAAIAKHAPAVKRVVVTSSFAAIITEGDLVNPARTFSEADWNPSTYEDGLTGAPATTYRVSKKYAEKAAWDFVKNKPGFDVATICPPMVFGPVAHHLDSLSGINTSNSRFVDLIQGKWKTEIPNSGVFVWVDVRDVAEAHVRAMELPEAGGKRFFTTAGYYDNRSILRVVSAAKVPELVEKDALPTDVDAVKGAPGADFAQEKVHKFDNAFTTKTLGISWTPLEKTAVDTVKSLLQIPA